MPPLLYIAVFCFFCAAGAYGIQKRKRWAWYCGWVYMFFAAAALGTPLVVTVFTAGEPTVIVFALLGLTGAVLLWMGWAIWWSRRQRDFGVDPRKESAALEASLRK